MPKTREELQAEIEARAKKYGIGVKEGGHLTKPSEYESLSDDQFADPVNYSYPIDQEHIVAAAQYWGKEKNQQVYTEDEQKIISERIEKAKKKFGVGQGSATLAASLRDDGSFVICSEILLSEEGKAPAEIQVLPLKKFLYIKDKKSHWEEIREKDLGEAIQCRKELGIDLVIDYEHQTLADPPVIAKAAGWIKELLNKGKDGLWARVEWTADAARMIAAREYRYFSPVFARNYLAANGRTYPFYLGPGALTNLPLIPGAKPVIAKEDGAGPRPAEVKKMWEKIKGFMLKILGLPETATDDEILVAAEKASTATEPVAAKEVLEALECKEGDSLAVVTGKIQSLKARVKSAPAPDELKVLKDKIADREANDLVVKAKQEGKITPAMESWAKEMALKDPEGFQKFLKDAPAICKEGVLLTPVPKKAGTLTEGEKKICAQMQISEEVFRKHNPQA